ncbi:hypothetical protein IPC367_27480 [Pseudomonas aeruginosa]|uniref:phage tail assembly chaperone n=1 Tax=Pseudomonas aeruginosa TaxID=287 RepID=UPI00066A4296|nr:phage tail assembly chaperone [Pseudomonas aeruginosa]ANA72987.1 hypothetical protein A6R75_23595 [Pseudomonas aeruginosa]EKL8565164.1 hypothetical protein [Pseudomonas aeruginosa]QTQ95439.1 hypothetical protein J9247_17085 [Pseudomonas aeruginosa]RUJ22127.1 hypothetical protein IPC367_27480 [Pseudomonas aeruginosa]HCF0197132.1 hypothetical protein [Pseudomonas aeruginosa]
MSKVKFSLDPKPTFIAPVPIPLHGGGSVEVKFTFKHMPKDDLDAFLKGVGELSDREAIMAVAAGWELDDAFNDENVQRLLQNYLGAGPAVVRVYMEQITQARLGN